jgi:hypothetical protein
MDGSMGRDGIASRRSQAWYECIWVTWWRECIVRLNIVLLSIVLRGTKK